MIINGYSARVIREFGRHIGGMPTYLQASTRYIDYKNFDIVEPKSIKNNELAHELFQSITQQVKETISYLDDLGIPREDSAMLLPLAMETKIIYRTNLRGLFDMAQQRLCNRAYWEYRELMNNVIEALCLYSHEWKYLIEDYKIFRSKCDFLGYCPESKSCGKMKQKK